MSVWYYGILYEDEKKVIAMYVGRGLDFPEEIAIRHIEYAKVIIKALEEAEKGYSNTILEYLDDAVKHLRKTYSPEMLLYIMFCLKMGIQPRIVSEYELFDSQNKKIIILGEEK